MEEPNIRLNTDDDEKEDKTLNVLA